MALHPTVHIGDQIVIDDEVAGEVVKFRPSGVALRWEFHFTKTDSFVAFLEGKQSKTRRPKDPKAGAAGEAEEAGDAGETGEGPTEDDLGGIESALQTAQAAADAEQALAE